VPARSRATLEKRRAQIEQWIAVESSPIREVELIQQRLDIDAQLAQIDQAARLPELEDAFVKVPLRGPSAAGSVPWRCGRRVCQQARSGGLACCEGRQQPSLAGPDAEWLTLL
jgi:hypothetical protein